MNKYSNSLGRKDLLTVKDDYKTTLYLDTSDEISEL